MKTRRAFFFVLFIVAVAVVVWFYTRKSAESPAVEPTTVETRQTNEAGRITVQQKKQAVASAPSAPTRAPENNPGAWIERRREQMEEERQRGLNEWRTPIEFYGKVIDENTNAVEGARVDFDCNDLSPTGTSFYNARSDTSGLFSIQGITGKLLGVKVSKAGYYSYQPHGLNFYYAGQNQNFVPDPLNPVIFRLKKKGVTEPLIAFDKTFQISISGRPLEIDLKSGMPTAKGKGDVAMEFVKQFSENGPNDSYDWSFKITVPNGGLILTTNQLDFLAPVNGYESSDIVEMKASSTSWQGRMDREYFIELPDGKFARVVLDLMSHNGSLRIQGFLNASGSRNLEPD